MRNSTFKAPTTPMRRSALLAKKPAATAKVRLRTCRICREKFAPVRAIQPTCAAFDCMAGYADLVAEKSKANRAKVERKVDKARKEAMEPRKWWLAKAKAALHAYIRARDEGKSCISCDTILVKRGRVGGDYDAGHFRSVGSSKHLQFVEANISGQCKHCNDYLKGNQIEYERGLRARHGDEYVEALKNDNEPRHLTIADFQAIEAVYKQKLKELQGKV